MMAVDIHLDNCQGLDRTDSHYTNLSDCMTLPHIQLELQSCCWILIVLIIRNSCMLKLKYILYDNNLKSDNKAS